MIGDRVQLQQVIVNLLVNSVQAIGHAGTKDGRVELSTGLGPGGEVVFVIRDNGPGIPEEDLDRIFEGFFTTKDEGMGLGLAICQSIMTAHGGGIAASNRPEGGACFRLWLPAEADAGLTSPKGQDIPSFGVPDYRPAQWWRGAEIHDPSSRFQAPAVTQRRRPVPRSREVNS